MGMGMGMGMGMLTATPRRVRLQPSQRLGLCAELAHAHAVAVALPHEDHLGAIGAAERGADQVAAVDALLGGRLALGRVVHGAPELLGAHLEGPALCVGDAQSVGAAGGIR